MHQFCKMERDEYMQKLVQFKHKLYGFPNHIMAICLQT